MYFWGLIYKYMIVIVVLIIIFVILCYRLYTLPNKQNIGIEYFSNTNSNTNTNINTFNNNNNFGHISEFEHWKHSLFQLFANDDIVSLYHTANTDNDNNNDTNNNSNVNDHNYNHNYIIPLMIITTIVKKS